MFGRGYQFIQDVVETNDDGPGDAAAPAGEASGDPSGDNAWLRHVRLAGRRLPFDDWVDDLELVVDAAGLDEFPLIGLSQGAAVAVAFAARHPDRVSRLILVGAYGRGPHVGAR